MRLTELPVTWFLQPSSEAHVWKGTFCTLLVSWYNYIGALACNPKDEAGIEARWSGLTEAGLTRSATH